MRTINRSLLRCKHCGTFYIRMKLLGETYNEVCPNCGKQETYFIAGYFVMDLAVPSGSATTTN